MAIVGMLPVPDNRAARKTTDDVPETEMSSDEDDPNVCETALKLQRDVGCSSKRIEPRRTECIATPPTTQVIDVQPDPSTRALHVAMSRPELFHPLFARPMNLLERGGGANPLSQRLHGSIRSNRRRLSLQGGERPDILNCSANNTGQPLVGQRGVQPRGPRLLAKLKLHNEFAMSLLLQGAQVG